MERRATRSVNGKLNIRIGIPAPVLKRGVRTRQLRTPDLITVVGVFHGPNGPRMAPHLNENGFEPALGFRVLEVMVIDPEHQTLPFLCRDRKSTRLNSSHRCISYAVFCL